MTPSARLSCARAFEDDASGRFTKQGILDRVTAAGLRNRRQQPLSSQAIRMLLRNRPYAGGIDVPLCQVRDNRGDFEPSCRRSCSTACRPCCLAA